MIWIMVQVEKLLNIIVWKGGNSFWISDLMKTDSKITFFGKGLIMVSRSRLFLKKYFIKSSRTYPLSLLSCFLSFHVVSSTHLATVLSTWLLWDVVCHSVKYSFRRPSSETNQMESPNLRLLNSKTVRWVSHILYKLSRLRNFVMEIQNNLRELPSFRKRPLVGSWMPG